jgi:hypothetical protein
MIVENRNGVFHLSQARQIVEDSSFSYYAFGEKDQGIVRSDGRILLPPGKASSVYSVGAPLSYFLVKAAGSGSSGVLDTKGTLIVDTIWADIWAAKGDTVWVKSQERGGCMGTWNLYSLASHKLILPEAHQLRSPVHASAVPQVATVSIGSGLFDFTKLQFISPPVMNSFYRLGRSDDDPYVVMSCTGRVGIMSARGKWLSDTSWTSIVQCSVYHFLLMTDTTEMLFDTKSPQQEMDSSIIYNRALTLARNDSPTTKGRLVMKAGLLKPWQQQLMFDTLFRSKESPDYRTIKNGEGSSCSCNDAEKYTGAMLRRDTPDELIHNVLFSGDSALSIEKTKMWGNYKRYAYFTLLLFPDGPRVVTLDELFTGTAWRNVIINAVLDYLRQHPEIEANCSNPAMFPEIFRNKFTLSQTGIVLHPDWHLRDAGTDSPRYIVEIPWEKLSGFLNEDVKRKVE